MRADSLVFRSAVPPLVVGILLAGAPSAQELTRISGAKDLLPEGLLEKVRQRRERDKSMDLYFLVNPDVSKLSDSNRRAIGRHFDDFLDCVGSGFVVSGLGEVEQLATRLSGSAGKAYLATVDAEIRPENGGKRVKLRFSIFRLVHSGKQVESIERIFSDTAEGTSTGNLDAAVIDAIRHKIALSFVRDAQLWSIDWGESRVELDDVVGPSLTSGVER